jgi:hypothetical protein
MTRDELMKRLVLKEAKPNPDRASTLNRRTRGSNYIETPEPHPAENFDDFFDYEKELTEFTPARDTVSNDIDQFTDAQTFTPPVMEPEEEDKSGFLIMEKIPTQTDKVNNITATVDSSDEASDLPFEFIRCTFVKEDGGQCKKQAKKGHEYCGIHRRFIEKNS